MEKVLVSAMLILCLFLCSCKQTTHEENDISSDTSSNESVTAVVSPSPTPVDSVSGENVATTEEPFVHENEPTIQPSLNPPVSSTNDSNMSWGTDTPED